MKRVLYLLLALFCCSCFTTVKRYETIYAEHPIDPPMQNITCVFDKCIDVLKI